MVYDHCLCIRMLVPPLTVWWWGCVQAWGAPADCWALPPCTGCGRRAPPAPRGTSALNAGSCRTAAHHPAPGWPHCSHKSQTTLVVLVTWNMAFVSLTPLHIFFVITSFWSGCLKVIIQRYCFRQSHVSFRSRWLFVVVAHNYMLLLSAIVLFQLSDIETFYGQSFSVVAFRLGSISASLFFFLFLFFLTQLFFFHAFVSVAILHFWPPFFLNVGNTAYTFHQSVKWDL